MTEPVKTPPNSIEVEKSLLGSALVSEDVLDQVMEHINEDYFYSKIHRTIFNAMQDLYNKENTVDITLLCEKLRSQNKLDKFGGETRISELVSSVSTSSNAMSYIEVLRGKMALRMLMKASGDIYGSVFEPEADPKELVDSAEQKIFAISDSNTASKAVPLKLLMGPVFKRIETMANTGGITGIQSGFSKLDECTTGFHPGELVIVAARPGMGKTAFCLSLAANAAIRVDKPRPIALFSLEMPKEQLVQRMLCSEAEVDMHKMRGGYLGSEDLTRLAVAGGVLAGANIYIDDTPAITPMEVRAKCRRIKSQEGDLGLVIIDYLQLMRASEKTYSREGEVGSISRNLKEISKELRVPVIALAQLSRASEQGGGSKRPMLSHLRESGSIEQDADIVIFVHRESYYMHKDDEGYEEAERVGELIVGKQRNGPLEDIPVQWEGQYTKFSNLDVTHEEPVAF